MLDLLVHTNHSTVRETALVVLHTTPLVTLEDPLWQYRCLRKLTGSYMRLLGHFRVCMVHEEQPERLNNFRRDVEILTQVLYRVVRHAGGVAIYPGSVFGLFSALWVDALLQLNSPCSIPTHLLPFASKLRKGTQLVEDRHVIRSERTISSKCTNLQSSKVITHTTTESGGQRLVYRKPLDTMGIWESEMDAATVCSALAMDTLHRVLLTPSTLTEENEEVREPKITMLVDMLLERLQPVSGVCAPTDEMYKDLLPNRSTHDVDLRTEQWLHHFPAFFPLVRAIVHASTNSVSLQSHRLLPVLKSALIVLLGHWNSVKGDVDDENIDVPPYMRNRNQLALTCELVRILRMTNWLPFVLTNTAELLPLTTPADIRAILFSCWMFLVDYPPTKSGAMPMPPPAVLDFYCSPLRQALHRNILYAMFMC